MNQITSYLTALLLVGAAGQLAAQGTAADQLVEDVRFLADDRLGGRLTGTPGADTAAAYLARRFGQAGLQPSPQGWLQAFVIHADAPVVQSANLGGTTGYNVIGVLPGSDPGLRNESVIVGAHYDHLGLGGFSSLDPDSTGLVHNGADDNASGAAALVHIARRLRGNPPARTVVFIAFGGEELGLLGSSYYVRNPVYPLSQSFAMVNMDMIGRLRNNRLIVFGAETATELPALLDSLNWYAAFDLKASGDGYGPSDHASFYTAGLPVVHVFTDLHEDYHRASDDIHKISHDGLLRVADFTATIVEALANRTADLTFVEAPRPSASVGPSQSSGYGAYLGSVPDMTGGTHGVRLTGVRKGSPADQAGIRADDVITRIGRYQVANLQDMSAALKSYKPGDEVDIVVLRGGVEHRTAVTLGRRGA
ncbi:MAG: M28 family peptidase [Gemmatimonadales bacterium]